MHTWLGIGGRLQHVVGSRNPLVSIRQLCLHAVEIGLGVQSSRVTEASVGIVCLCHGRHDRGQEEHQQ